MATNVVQDRLGDLFVREGLITQGQLEDALEEAKRSKTRIGFALVKLGFVAEDQLTRALAKQFRVPAVVELLEFARRGSGQGKGAGID